MVVHKRSQVFINKSRLLAKDSKSLSIIYWSSYEELYINLLSRPWRCQTTHITLLACGFKWTGLNILAIKILGFDSNEISWLSFVLYLSWTWFSAECSRTMSVFNCESVDNSMKYLCVKTFKPMKYPIPHSKRTSMLKESMLFSNLQLYFTPSLKNDTNVWVCGMVSFLIPRKKKNVMGYIVKQPDHETSK